MFSAQKSLNLTNYSLLFQQDDTSYLETFLTQSKEKTKDSQSDHP